MHNIKKIARMIIELNEWVYNTYKPIVDDICKKELTLLKMQLIEVEEELVNKDRKL